MPRPPALRPLGALFLILFAMPLTPAVPQDPRGPVTLAQGLRIAEQYRVPAFARRRFTHAEFWTAVGPYLGGPTLRTEEVGRSIQGREIRAVSYGSGPVTVLLWSQMHGDEATATMALADIFRFLSEAPRDPLAARLARELTVVMVPMLNPDGAELFQRQNAAGIDVNRDARELATPEARTLKALRDRLRPAFGFNLHDQGARTRAGRDGLPAAIALLPPAYDEARSYNEVRTRARLVAAGIAAALAPELTGRVARYDDDFNPRAFGDLMQGWGTSTVLIESGGLPGDPEKQRLRAINVAAILGALDAIATGAYRQADPAAYEGLPQNYGGAVDLLVRGGTLVLPESPPLLLRTDLAINFDDPVARTGPRLHDVGDLATTTANDTVQADGLYLHPRPESLTLRGGHAWFRLGDPVWLDLRRGADPAGEVVTTIPDRPAAR